MWATDCSPDRAAALVAALKEGAVIFPDQSVRIVIATKPVDFRKGHDGLASMAQAELGFAPKAGVMVVFRSKRGDRVKVLFWDGSGIVMIYKRLEQGGLSATESCGCPLRNLGAAQAAITFNCASFPTCYGPEYISTKLLEWAEKQGVTIKHIQPGQPQQNAYIERYNRTVRHEWLDQYIIETIEPNGDCRQSPVGQWKAQDFATQWLWTYNNDRPNMGIGGITPAMKLKMAA